MHAQLTLPFHVANKSSQDKISRGWFPASVDGLEWVEYFDTVDAAIAVIRLAVTDSNSEPVGRWVNPNLYRYMYRRGRGTPWHYLYIANVVEMAKRPYLNRVWVCPICRYLAESPSDHLCPYGDPLFPLQDKLDIPAVPDRPIKYRARR